MKRLRFFLIEKLRIQLTLVFFAFLYSSVFFMGINPDVLPVIISFSSWHLSTFLFNKVYDIEEDRLLNKGVITDVEAKYFTISAFLLLLFPILVLYAFDFLLYPYLIFSPLGILYSIPLTKRTNIRIKNILIVKNLYASLATVGAPLIVLVYYSGIESSMIPNMLSILFYIFLIFFVIEIICDIPDMEGDMQVGVETIPNKLGVNNTKILVLFILVVATTMSFILRNYFLLILPIFLYVSLIRFSNSNRKAPFALIFYGFLVIFLTLNCLGLLYRF